MRATFPFLSCLAVVLAGLTQAGGAKADDGPAPAVRMYVQVELRGTYRHGGAYVETKEHVEVRPPTTEPNYRHETEVRWQLDLRGSKLTAEEMRQLDGKVVEAVGRAELRWVSPTSPNRLDALGKAIPPQLELRRVLAVATLKGVEKK